MLQITAIGLISVGIVYVLLLGEIDLSVGAVSGLAAAVMAVLNVKHGWNPYLAIAAAVAVGAGDRPPAGLRSSAASASPPSSSPWPACWPGRERCCRCSARPGRSTSPTRRSPASPTPSTRTRSAGSSPSVAIAAYGGRARARPPAPRRRRPRRREPDLAGRPLRRWSPRSSIAAVAVLNSDRGVPLAVLILLAFVVGMEYVVKRTRFGRHVFAVGGNAEAARRAGIRVNGIRDRGLRDRRHDGGDRRHHGRLAPARRQPELRRQRTAAARDRRPGDRRHQPLRRPRLGLDGAARRPGDRLDLQRHGPARALLGGQVHGHRRRPAAGGPGRRGRRATSARPPGRV